MNRLYNILNGVINPFGKVLWEGTWSSGSITVNGISKYSLLMMEQAGEPIIVVNDGSVLRGMSMAASGSVHYGRAFSSNISGNTLTLPGENNITQIAHQASGNHGAISRQSITKIVGLVPNWGGYCIAVFSRLATIFSFVRRWRHEQVIQHIGRSRHQSDNVYTYITHRERVRSKDRRPLRKSHGAYSRRVRFSLLDMVGAKRMGWCNHTVKSEARHNKLLCTICVERIISKWQLRCSCAIPKANNLIHNIPERGCVA